MIRHLFIFFLFLFPAIVAAQVNVDSVLINKDSIERELDLFLEQYGKSTNKSSLQLTTGILNSALSVNNKALNAQQTNSPFLFSTGLNYRHKTGVTLSAEQRFLLNGYQSSLLQSAFSAGYWHQSEGIYQTGVNYTQYLINPAQSSIATPYSGEWFAFGQLDKWKLVPFLSLGYAYGNYRETNKTDSSILLNRPFPRPDTTIRFSINDTFRVKLKDFSMTLGLSYPYIHKMKKQGHAFSVTPSLLFFFAQNNYDVEYTSVSVLSPITRVYLQQRPLLREELIRQFRQQFSSFNQTRSFLNTTRFTLQSIGFNLDAVFYRKKFFLHPQMYLDYYLLGNTNKLSAFYSMEIGLIF
jgi:hypothetical protein